MFKVGNLRINFKHEHHLLSEKNGMSCYEGTGRFGVTCFIKKEYGENMCIGRVLVHKGDLPDRVIGKKYALMKAMIAGYTTYGKGEKIKKPIYHAGLTKLIRTEIWKAFWAWTETWKPLKVEFIGRVDSIVVPPLSEQRDIGAQISICLDTKNLSDNINDLLGAEAIVTIERTSK